MNQSPADTCAPSPLNKPLSDLTEEDIAQLTREDCRRFLKLKGMRRPSWNKSQAIQQVISLKALLDHLPRQSPPPPRKPLPDPPPPPVSVPSNRAAEDPSPYRRKDPNPNPITPHLTWAARADPAVDDRPLSPPRDEPAQMTIFYGDKVYVYSDVPVEKARAIMHLAASPMDLNEPPPGPVQASHTVNCIGPGPSEWAPEGESEDGPGGPIDCPTGRQASLLRYREKRKDRYKGKRIIGGPPSSMEMMILSQKFRAPTPTEQSSGSNTSSPTQPRPPCTPTRCNSIDNQAQKFRFSIDLNDDGRGDL